VRKLLLVTVIVGLLAVMAVSVQADGAVVIKDFGCNVFQGDGSIVVTGSTQAVVTPSDNGKWTCKAKGVTPPPGDEAVFFNYENTGFECLTAAGLTTKWQNVVTPSGVSIISCHVNPGE
jgi:hypothetical protein